MTQKKWEKVQKEIVNGQYSEEPPEFNVDYAIERMKKVGYRDEEGYTVLPKNYDD